MRGDRPTRPGRAKPCPLVLPRRDTTDYLATVHDVNSYDPASGFVEGDWQPSVDGRVHRTSGRVILTAGDDVLLLAAHEPDEPSQRFWFTPGGGVHEGESVRGAAVREVREEAGLVIVETDLIGPVATWDSRFTFVGTPIHQRNVYYWCSAATHPGQPALTALEERMMDGSHWLPMSTVSDLDDPLYPPDLPILLGRLAAGWDGTVFRFDPQSDV